MSDLTERLRLQAARVLQENATLSLGGGAQMDADAQRALEVDLERAADELDRLHAETERLRDAHRLIELIGYMEDRQFGWMVAHMKGVASDVLAGRSLDSRWRMFPRHRTALKGETP